MLNISHQIWSAHVYYATESKCGSLTIIIIMMWSLKTILMWSFCSGPRGFCRTLIVGSLLITQNLCVSGQQTVAITELSTDCDAEGQCQWCIVWGNSMHSFHQSSHTHTNTLTHTHIARCDQHSDQISFARQSKALQKENVLPWSHVSHHLLFTGFSYLFIALVSCKKLHK